MIPIRIAKADVGSPEDTEITNYIDRVMNAGGYKKKDLTRTKIFPSELPLFVDYFNTASKNVTKDAKDSFRKSEDARTGGLSLFELSFLYVPEESEIKVGSSVRCGHPDCSNPGDLRCSICRTGYCSKTCQKDDWKAHKTVCQQRAGLSGCTSSSAREKAAKGDSSTKASPSTSLPTSDRYSVMVTSADHQKEMAKMPSQICTSYHTGQMYNGLSKTIFYKEGEFIIKVQGSPTGGLAPKLVYDKERSFTIYLAVDSESSRRIHAFCKQFARPYPSLPYSGDVKIYLYAKTEGAGLRVFLDKFAPLQSW